MKKISMLLSLIVALCMFVMPMGAMAEPTTAQVIQIANPSIFMDGQEVASLDGLALQAAYCEGYDVAQFIFDLFVGGENATSAMVQVDSDTNVVGYVGGMSNAYTVNLAEVAQTLLSQIVAESGIDMNQVANIISMAENWTLPEDIIYTVAAHEGDFAMNDLGVSNNADGVPMQYMQITGDIMPVIFDVLRVIDNDQLINAVVQLLDPSMSGLGISEAISGVNVSAVIDMKIGVDETGNLIEGDISLILGEDGQTVGTINMKANIDASNYENITAVITLDMIEAGGENVGTMTANYVITSTGMTCEANGLIAGTPMSITMNMVATDTGMTMHMYENINGAITEMDINANIDGVNDIVYISAAMDDMMSFKLDYKGGVTQNGYAFNAECVSNSYGYISGFSVTGDAALTSTEATLDLTLTEISEYDDNVSIALSLYLDPEFNFSGKLTVDDTYSDPVSLALSLTTVEPADGAYYSGVIAFEADDGYSLIGLDADIHLLEVDVDTDSFYISPAAAISLMTMDDTQMGTAMNELDGIMEAIGNALMTAYPDIFGY